jgi:hypothetical protein
VNEGLPKTVLGLYNELLETQARIEDLVRYTEAVKRTITPVEATLVKQQAIALGEYSKALQGRIYLWTGRRP